jgi:hypothetical protein
MRHAAPVGSGVICSSFFDSLRGLRCSVCAGNGQVYNLGTTTGPDGTDFFLDRCGSRNFVTNAQKVFLVHLDVGGCDDVITDTNQ